MTSGRAAPPFLRSKPDAISAKTWQPRSTPPGQSRLIEQEPLIKGHFVTTAGEEFGRWRDISPAASSLPVCTPPKVSFDLEHGPPLVLAGNWIKSQRRDRGRRRDASTAK